MGEGRPCCHRSLLLLSLRPLGRSQHDCQLVALALDCQYFSYSATGQENNFAGYDSVAGTEAASTFHTRPLSLIPRMASEPFSTMITPGW